MNTTMRYEAGLLKRSRVVSRPQFAACCLLLAGLWSVLCAAPAAFAREDPDAPARPLGDAAWRSFVATDASCQALEQPAQDFLKRVNYRFACGKDCDARHQRVIEYRTRHYGRFKEFGEAAWNPQAPRAETLQTRFVGLDLRVNRHLLPLLACVERDLGRDCATCEADPRYPGECEAKDFPYRPKRLSGLRTRNTFRGGEVSTHVYGIGLDLDPTRNTCCRCVKKWRSHPLCAKDLPLHLRMAMPMCWVHVFERYGFYWLGEDRLQDTMHVEFLGEPERVEEVLRATHQKNMSAPTPSMKQSSGVP